MRGICLTRLNAKIYDGSQLRHDPSHGLAALLIWPTRTQLHKVTLFATSRHCLVLPTGTQTLDEEHLSVMAQSFYSAPRNIGSQVIKPELGVDLLYPDYKAGLATILEAKKSTD